MPATEEKPITADDLIAAAQRLDEAELERLYTGVRRMRMPKFGGVLSARETELFEHINRGFDAATTERYRALIRRRKRGTLTEEERREHMALSDLAENIAADRLLAVAELAELRGIPAQEMLRQLGIPSRNAGEG
jgi:hypothetical protein